MKKSIQLLKKSIDIWKAAHKRLIAVKGKMGFFNGASLSVDNEIYSHGYLDCPLCENYFGKLCSRCPIKIKTGIDSCINTPYYLVYSKGEYKTREITNNDIKNHLKMIRWMEKLYKELTETNE